MKKSFLFLALLLIGCKKEQPSCPSEGVPSFNQADYLNATGPNVWSAEVCGSVVTVKGSKARCNTGIRFTQQSQPVDGNNIHVRLTYLETPDPCPNETFSMSVDVSKWRGYGETIYVKVNDCAIVTVNFN